MAAKSTYLANQLLGHVFGKSTFTAPTAFYFCLLKVAALPSNTGSTLVEVAYSSYVRLQKHTGDMSAVAAQTISNAGPFTWAPCGATGDTAVAWAVCDALTGGNVLYYGVLTAPLVIATGDVPTVDAAALTFAEL
jgi:hypothetical protein